MIALALTLPLLLAALAFVFAYRRPPVERPRIGTPAPLTSLRSRAQARREERYLSCASTGQAVAYHAATPDEKVRILNAWRLAQECSRQERLRAALELPPTDSQ